MEEYGEQTPREGNVTTPSECHVRQKQVSCGEVTWCYGEVTWCFGEVTWYFGDVILWFKII